MLISSKWSIVLLNTNVNPAVNITLLSLLDGLDEEPKILRGCQNDISRPLRSPTAIPLRSYNAEYSLPFARTQLFDSDDLAWEAALLWTNNLPVGPAIGGTITTTSGIEFILTNCLLQPGAAAQTESNKLKTTFTLVFSQIAFRRRIKTGAGNYIDTGAGNRINA